MLVFIFSLLSKKEFDEPALVYYAVMIELLADSFVVGLLYRLVVAHI